jgi:hypothetical protein
MKSTMKSARAPADEPAPSPIAPPSPSVRLNGLVDVYAAWNPNRPSDQENFEPDRGTNGEKANQFVLNLAKLDDHWSAQIWVMNSWQSIKDNNNGKPFGGQVAFRPGPLTVTENVFAGPELTDDDARGSVFSELILGAVATF